MSYHDIVERNARIESTRLDIERGFLTGWVFLDFGGSGQGFGGHVLSGQDLGPDYSAIFIKRVLEVVGCETWEGLKGRPCRVRCSMDKVYTIGHFLKEEWFHIESEFSEAASEFRRFVIDNQNAVL